MAVKVTEVPAQMLFPGLATIVTEGTIVGLMIATLKISVTFFGTFHEWFIHCTYPLFPKVYTPDDARTGLG